MDKPHTDSWELLAFLRFVLAAIVMAAHLQASQSIAALRFITQFGAFSAVLAFLLVSGYSMGHSYSRNPDRFLARRLIRIYPLYCLAILFTSAVLVLSHTNDPNKMLKAGLANLLFLQTYHFMAMPGNAVVWTLGVEAVCYLLTPQFGRMRTHVLVALAGASAVAFSIYPQLKLNYYGALLHGEPLLFVIWAWLAGFIYQRCRFNPSSGPILVATLVGLCSVNQIYNERFSNITLLAAGLVVIGSGAIVLPSMIGTIASFLGDLSYPLYLFHFPIFWGLALLFHHNYAAVPICAAFGVSLVALGIDSVLKPHARRACGWAETVYDDLSDRGVQLARTTAHRCGNAYRIFLPTYLNRQPIVFSKSAWLIRNRLQQFLLKTMVDRVQV